MFLARTNAFQARVVPAIPALEGRASLHPKALRSLVRLGPRVARFVRGAGPSALHRFADGLTPASLGRSVSNYLERRDASSPESLFARILLQPALFLGRPDPGPTPQGEHHPGPVDTCPWCGHLPQAGSLLPDGDGTALHWTCSLCWLDWPAPLSRCPACGRSGKDHVVQYSSAELQTVRMLACETCRCYVYTVERSQDREAIADVDELTALPLDVWAAEQGFRKLQPNLLGI